MKIMFNIFTKLNHWYLIPVSVTILQRIASSLGVKNISSSPAAITEPYRIRKRSFAAFLKNIQISKKS